MSEVKEEKFEDKLKKLEELVSSLDKDDLSLDESIEIFEKGIKLSKECSEKLENAEKKINILLSDENGNLKEEKFEVSNE